MVTMEDVVTEPVLTQAFAWLCRQRRDIRRRPMSGLFGATGRRPASRCWRRTGG